MSSDSNTTTGITVNVDDLNDVVLRGLSKEHELWLSGVRWALGDVSKQDLEMMVADSFGGDKAMPGPDKRLVGMARRLMEYAR
jgi:hypothetical protein